LDWFSDSATGCTWRLEVQNLRAGLEHDFVDVAPSPVFARLERANNRVLSLLEVLCGVFIFGGIAAADMAAGLAEPQVHPGVTHLETLLAAAGVGRYVVYLVKV
jgi:hypothetical protein